MGPFLPFHSRSEVWKVLQRLSGRIHDTFWFLRDVSGFGYVPAGRVSSRARKRSRFWTRRLVDPSTSHSRQRSDFTDVSRTRDHADRPLARPWNPLQMGLLRNFVGSPHRISRSCPGNLDIPRCVFAQSNINSSSSRVLPSLPPVREYATCCSALIYG